MEVPAAEPERSPLLSHPNGRPKKRPVPFYQLQRPAYISALTCVGVFLWMLTSTLAALPAMRLTEDIFCRRYYGRDEEIDERLCKVDKVQSQVAYIFGFCETLNGVCGLAVALPFGLLADRARKSVYILGTVGHSLGLLWTILVIHEWRAIPVEWILAGPVFQSLGGGLLVATSLLQAMLSDVVTPENRARWFFFFSLSQQTAGFIGAPLSSKLIEAFSPWVPLAIVAVLGPLNILLMILMPETVILTDPGDGDEEEIDGESEPHWWSAAITRCKQGFKDAWGSLAMLTNRAVIMLLLCILTLIPVNVSLGSILLQYVSQRFGWSLADTGYLLALRGGFVILVMGFVLPGISTLLTSGWGSASLSMHRKDLFLARCCAVALLVGCIFLAGPGIGYVAVGLVITALGSGLGPLCRSLVLDYVETTQTSSLFTSIGMIETAGSIPAGPLLAAAFSAGMHLRGFFYSLPYETSATFALVSVIALMILKPARRRPRTTECTPDEGLDGSG
ncbi:MFS general substrate transporter [Xylariaceae sp. FL0662B]|nr:MFS general substrate transporter [Xylariaceae sp. FL0662B]